MILLKNSQRAVPISTKLVRTQIQLLLSAAGYRDWDIGVQLTSNPVIRQLNAQYRSKDKPTDILSFPFTEAVRPGLLPTPRSTDDMNLGDIYISMAYVKKWCQEHGVSVEERLPRLYAHGICHLLGYDHQKDVDYKQMKGKEDRMLKRMREWQESI